MSAKKSFLISSLIILVTTNSVWAVTPPWNPDDPNDLKFILDFENNPNATTTIARGWWGDPGPPFDTPTFTGTLMDYNTAGWDAWEANGKIGTSGDFRYYNDKLPWGAPNDCRVSVNPNMYEVLNFGNETVKRTWTFWFWDVDYNESNVPQPILTESTFLRHQNKFNAETFWDMSIKNTKLSFRHNYVGGAQHTFETVDDVNSLGIAPRHGIMSPLLSIELQSLPARYT